MMANPKVVQPASEIPVLQRYCTCCERALTSKVAWLEFDMTKQLYTDSGMVEHSQGWFPFGMACARKELAKWSLT